MGHDWLWMACVAHVLVCLSVTAALRPPERPYKILMLLPSSSKSHRNVFMPLATALTDRGHKITMLSNHPPHDTNPNIEYITHGMEHFEVASKNFFELQKNPLKMFEMFSEMFPKIARDLYTVPQVKDLYDRRKNFDLTIIDSMFNEATYPFVHEQPFITISPGAIDPSLSAIMGNLQNPAYVPTAIEYFPHPLSFINRIKNVVMSIAGPWMWRNSIEGPTQIEISKQFPHLPHLRDIERNQSLNLINSHFTMTSVMPLLPNQVEVGGMHLRPAKPLPKDIEDFLSGSTPVIYFSLGSIARSSSIDPKHKKIILNVFAKLPYKVLWKYEEAIPNLPKTILIQKWLPQQDILAHPNVKVFISHCGLLGSQEAIYHGTPIFGMPIFGDQPKNAKIWESKGFGKKLLWNDLTEQRFMDSVIEIIENPSYRETVAGVSKQFRDQPMSPTDRAVYWTEYVIRHKGATHLRSPEQDLTWVQLLHLDIIFLINILTLLLCKLLCKFCRLCFGSSKNAKPQNKNKRE